MAVFDRLFSSGSSAGDRKSRLTLTGIVFLAAFAVYANSLTMGFVWDDIQQILEPGPTQSLANIPYFFSNSVSAGHKFGNETPYYRPLFSLSNAIDYALWGLTPLGYHLTNILLHAAVSGLVFMIALRLLAVPASALFTGLVYAFHPVHAEAVAYVAARNELLCALFMAASALLYLNWRDNMTPVRFMAVQLLFFPALLSKEMAVTMPLLIGCYEITVGDSRFRRAFLRAILFAVTVGAYLVLRSVMLEMANWGGPPLAVRALTGITLLAGYLQLLLVPFNLKTLYDIPLQWELMQVDVLIPLLAILIPAVLAVYLYRRDRILCFGISWIYLALIPVSGLPALIMPAYMAERYLYIPSIGFAILCGRLAEIALRNLPLPIPPPLGEGVCSSPKRGEAGRGVAFNSTVLTISTALLLAYSVTTVLHNRNWQDEPTLYKGMIRDAPAHQIGYDLLGSYYGKRQNDNSSMAKYYMQSRMLAKKQQVALGDSYMKHGYYAKAQEAYMQLLTAGYGDDSIKQRLAAALAAKTSTKQ